jgi:transcriptional regulatory protein LevR
MLKEHGATDESKDDENLERSEIKKKIESLSQKYKVLFGTISKDQNAESVSLVDVHEYLKKSGFQSGNQVIAKQILDTSEGKDDISWIQFRNMMFGRKIVLQRAFTQKLVISKWKNLCDTIIEIYGDLQKNVEGKLPDYQDVLSEESRKDQ